MLQFFKNIFSKPSIDDSMESRVNDVYIQLVSRHSVGFSDLEFTELEKVQILNEVRRRLNENFKNKHSEYMSKITEYNQKIKELKDAESYLN